MGRKIATREEINRLWRKEISQTPKTFWECMARIERLKAILEMFPSDAYSVSEDAPEMPSLWPDNLGQPLT